MSFICTSRTSPHRDGRADRAAAAERVWVRFLLEIVFRRRLEPEARQRLMEQLQENLVLLLRKGALFPTQAPATPEEANLEFDPGWMLSLPVLEVRFREPVPMEPSAREQLASHLESALNTAIAEGRLLRGEDQAGPLLAWVRAHPDQRRWPSPSLLEG